MGYLFKEEIIKMIITQSAASQRHFRNYIKKKYGKAYVISSIITKLDAREYPVGKYTAILRRKR